MPRFLMPDIRQLAEQIKPSNADKGDGIYLLPWMFSRADEPSYFRSYIGNSNDHHPLQEAEVETQDCAHHQWDGADEQ